MIRTVLETYEKIIKDHPHEFSWKHYPTVEYNGDTYIFFRSIKEMYWPEIKDFLIWIELPILVATKGNWTAQVINLSKLKYHLYEKPEQFKQARRQAKEADCEEELSGGVRVNP